MRVSLAVFKNQVRDLLKNRETLIMFLVFPGVAFIMTEFVAKPTEGMPDTAFLGSFIPMFSCMVLIQATCFIIAEEKEKKSLKFLMMAGVKPQQYIAGVGGALLAASIIVGWIFSAIGGFGGQKLAVYGLFFLLNVIGSILIGASCGLLSRNMQAATGLSTPVAFILGFLPMFASFNEDIHNLTRWIYSVRFAEMASLNQFEQAIFWPLIITLGNLAVLAIVFALIYRRRGLARA